MARPSPTVLNEVTNPKTWKTRQILETKTGLWGVTYRGQFFAVKDFHKFIAVDTKNIRYPRMTFSSKGAALRSARDLNAAFKCQDFEVVELGVIQKA